MSADNKTERPKWHRLSDNYKAHRLANKRDWDASRARQMSLADNHNAQFDPHVLPPLEIVKLELECLEKGIPITDLNDEESSQHKFYMDCREHFRNQSYV